MWEVVGYNVRLVKCKDGIERRYYDIYLQREAQKPAEGFETAAADFREDRYPYVPQLGDKIFAAFGRSAEGRVYLAELQFVSHA